MKGELVGAGADWLLLGPDNYGRLDVRFTMKTHDGALIYVQYFGVIEVTPTITDTLAGGTTPTDFGDQYFFTNPRCETSDERYTGQNHTVLLARAGSSRARESSTRCSAWRTDRSGPPTGDRTPGHGGVRPHGQRRDHR